MLPRITISACRNKRDRRDHLVTIMPCSTLPQDDGGVRIKLDRPEVLMDLMLNADGTVRSIEADVRVGDIEGSKRLGLLEAAKRIGGGIWGVVKAEAGIDRATELLATTRLNTCKACENYVPCWKDSDKMCCGPMIASIKSTRTCGCWLSKKVRITAEKCPIDKW